MAQPKFIVAEITKTWYKDSLTEDLISNKFEVVINTNSDRGYELKDWRLNSVINDDGSFTETIIAIFECKY